MGKKKYYGIFLSYLLILVIPLFLGLFLHLYNKKLVIGQSEEMAEKMLASIQEQTDAYMENIWQTALIASQLESVQKASRMAGQSEIDKAYQFYQVGKDLSMFNSSTYAVKDLFVYFREEDKIVGMRGTADPDSYCQMFFGEHVKGAELKAELDSFRYMECVSMKNKREADDIVCFLSNPWAVRSDFPDYVIAVVIEEEALQSLVDSIRWMEEITVIIRERNGRIVCETGKSTGELPASFLTKIEDTQMRYREIEWDNEKYALMADQSSETNWMYYMMIPESVIAENANQIQKYYFLMLFSCSIIGFVIAGVLSKKQYHPIQVLSDVIAYFKSQSNAETDVPEEDSYQWLHGQVEKVFKERVQDMKLLKENEKELKHYYLLRLLENSYTADLDKNLEKCQITFTHPYYMVVRFQMHPPIENMEEQALLQFVIQNIFTELTEENRSLQVYMVHTGAYMVGILNLSAREEAGVIKELVYQMQDMIETQFHYKMIALLGDCYGSRTEIFKSYEDVGEMEEYAGSLGDTLLCYEDVRNMEQTYRYNAELNQKLFNAVKAGNQKSAGEQLHMILGQNGGREISVYVYHSLCFDIVGTILKAADAGGYHQVVEETAVIEKISAYMPLVPLEELLGEWIAVICNRIQNMQNEIKSDTALSRSVQEYVLEHFRNPDLNISLTALHFQMTPSYLSAIYKKQTGGTLLDFINRVRLDEAERLLEQGMTVSDVAEQAGFRDSTYLIRVFKKKKGITPGQKKSKL